MNRSKDFPAPINDTVVLKAKHVVVLGDDPIALSMTIALKQKGANVIIIGPRLGSYTRSEDHVPHDVTEAINLLIAPKSIEDTPSRHIKDLEKQLYSKVNELRITQIKAAFWGFVNKDTIAIKYENNRIQNISADLLYDATGTSRAVIKKINEAHPDNPIFTLTPIPGNPHKSYAMIRAIMSAEDLEAIYTLANPERWDPLIHIQAMEILQQLGWESHSMPYIYANKLPKKIRDPNNPENPEKFKNDPDFFKMHVYLQIPKSMTSEESIIQFADTLFKLGKNLPCEEGIPQLLKIQDKSKKSGKSMISCFETNTTLVTPEFYLGDEQIPPVIHIGDATCDIPLISGQGIIKGTQQCRSLIRASAFKKENSAAATRTSATINITEYRNAFSSAAESYRELTLKIYNNIYREHIETTFTYYVKSLEKQHEQLHEEKNNNFHISISNRLKTINPNYFFKKFLTAIKAISEEKTIAKASEQENLLANALAWMQETQTIKNKLLENEKKLFDNAIQQLAAHYKILGNHFINACTAHKGIACYNHALTLYGYYENTFSKEIIILYSNLIIAHTSDIDKVIELATLVQTTYNLQDKEVGLPSEKIFYHKASALIKKMDVLLSNTNNAIEPIQAMAREANEIIDFLTYKKPLIEQFAQLKQKYPDFFSTSADAIIIHNPKRQKKCN